jgi:hypothetical protein
MKHVDGHPKGHDINKEYYNRLTLAWFEFDPVILEKAKNVLRTNYALDEDDIEKRTVFDLDWFK